jgi:UDP-glucose 4-epimerase
MNALITGGAGFIGSHLTGHLLDLGWEVHVIDDLSTGAIKNIHMFKKNPRFSYSVDTVLNRPLMTELVDEADVVFHLAAVVGVQLVLASPVNTIETNIKTTELVLELCARKNTPVLLTSTSEVYGKSDASLFKEDDDMILGSTSYSRWCYASTKIIDEFLAQAYTRERGLPAVAVRLFNTVGPRQSSRYGMVVPRFVDQAILGDPITVYGDGAQRRSFTWVGDVVAALVSLTSSGSTGVFNVGHTKDISIWELAETVKEMTDSTSEIILVPYEEAYTAEFEDMRRRQPDLTKIHRAIGYSPTLNLREILTRIIDANS